ncbi:MAG TPA: ABC transporter substrate-binding protein [Alphaproteobacteria bacterium]|jgi:NitT/TauT family transport system substrate-binding protein
MMRLKRSGLVAALILIAAPAKAEDIVITQFGVAFAGNPFAIAIDGGYFKKAGVDITGIIAGAGGGTSVRNVIASGLGYGEVVLSAAIAAIREGQDIRVVNVGARSVADVVVVVKPESPIKSLKDLEGKKIGFSNPKSLSEILAIMALEKGGLKAEQAQRVALGSLGGALTALEKGSVEAAITMQVVWAQRADKLRVILDAGRDLPPMVQSVGIATGDLMRKNPEKLRKLLAARRDAVRFMNEKPEDAAKMLEKHFPKMPPEVLRKVTISLAKNGYWSEGRLEREPMENMARGLKLVGDLKEDIDWSKFTDASFLPKDLQ